MADSAPNTAHPNAESPKTVASALGEVVWLMSQSPTHKHFAIADLEWLVMPALLLKQCSILWDVRDNGEVGDVSENHSANRPQSIGALPRHEELAFLSDGVSLRPSRAGLARRRVQDGKMDSAPVSPPQINYSAQKI